MYVDFWLKSKWIFILDWYSLSICICTIIRWWIKMMFIHLTVIFHSPVIKVKVCFVYSVLVKKIYKAKISRTEWLSEGKVFFWIITHLLISVSEKRDVESKECMPMSFYRAIERYETAKDAPLHIFFDTNLLHQTTEWEKKGKKNYIVDHTRHRIAWWHYSFE